MGPFQAMRFDRFDGTVCTPAAVFRTVYVHSKFTAIMHGRCGNQDRSFQSLRKEPGLFGHWHCVRTTRIPVSVLYTVCTVKYRNEAVIADHNRRREGGWWFIMRRYVSIVGLPTDNQSGTRQRGTAFGIDRCDGLPGRRHVMES